MTKPSHAIRVNGEATDVSAQDRGIAYGDGLFETMLCIGGRIPLRARHFARLETDAGAIGIAAPRQELWDRDIDAVLDTADCPERCTVKLILTRGRSEFGYAPADDAVPTRIVMRLGYPETDHSEGLRCDLLSSTLGASRRLAGIKHLNRLEQVLAAQEMNERGLEEGLVCNAYGFVVEAVSSNVVFAFGDRIVTPKLDSAGVRGVMRDLLIEHMAETQSPIVKDFVHRDAVAQADEIILCNSVRGVRRVQRFGDKTLTKRAVFDRLAEVARCAYEGSADRA